MLRLNLLAVFALVAVTQQAVYRPANPWFQYGHPQFYGLQNAYLQGLLDGGRLGISPSTQQKENSVVPAQQGTDDAHARFRSPFFQVNNSSLLLFTFMFNFICSKDSSNETNAEDLGRLFLTGATIGSGASANLLKTSFVFTTSTATLCYMSTCIPAGQFVAGSSNVICRRKRQEIAPSAVEA